MRFTGKPNKAGIVKAYDEYVKGNPVDVLRCLRSEDLKLVDKILKKVGEESTEVIIAAKSDEGNGELIYELADLYYHALVLMIEKGVSLDQVRNELASRHVIDHKVKQEKMTADGVH